MAEENKQLNELARVLTEQLETGGDFVMEQAPALASEMVLVGRICETGALVVMVLLTLWGIMTLRKMLKTLQKEGYKTDNEEVGMLLQGITGGFATLIGGMLSFFGAWGVITVWFAPKLYILERVTSMLGG